ncbi:HTTM domain-containing protein [Virgibacillus sp. AGTR]|uniref:HTTM domain-containing protein n=1 Tax=Virgibacillus sp. AGTR TaxID=2812055 RepID=UPI0019647F44|nr:HTTM domain-containing protein [Virgibacillus sp. AGTR]MCC2252450.1 HTTM domain-containing protein [Virgibacillus sp. AGTR]QRZ16580.1 HTTM domain-containing protein [Virgibacillus sp. AGTR]
MNKIYEKLSTQKHMLIGTSLIRIAFGLLILYFYFIHYGQRRFLWGPNGMQDHETLTKQLFTTNNFSIYQLNDSLLYFEIIFHIGVVIAFFFTIGFMGRLTAILNFIFIWSLQHANVLILDGGDNVMRIILFYLLFANTTAFFSLDGYRRKQKVSSITLSPSLSNAFHNLAVLASIIQVSFMYLTSGMHKIMGEVWQNGTALYYILQVDEYTHPFFKELVISSDFLLLIGAYGAIFAQITYPFLLFNRYTRYIAIFNIIAMHIGIAIVMGLFTFSATMISIQLVLLKNEEYERAYTAVKRLLSKLRLRKGKQYEVEQIEQV